MSVPDFAVERFPLVNRVGYVNYTVPFSSDGKFDRTGYIGSKRGTEPSLAH
jgi:hypothetical protein